MREPAKAASVEVNCEGLIAGHEHVDSHVELLTTDQEWVHDVALNDVWLGLRTIWLPTEVILPLSYLLQLREQEDSPALRFSHRFHNPYTSSLLEFFNKD